MKPILILVFLFSTSIFATAETLVSAENNPWNNSFTNKMNQMLPVIYKELEKDQNQCVSISVGVCLGHSEVITLSDGTKREKFSGMCSLGGNHCDINTDAGWQVMVQGLDGKFNFVKIVNTYKEI